MKTNQYINILLENGIHFSTISKMNKSQIKVLAERFETKEAVTTTAKTGFETNITAGSPATLSVGGAQIEIDPTKGTKITSKDKPTGTGETKESVEIGEKFESKAQQKLFYAKCGDGKTKEEKKWCKMKDEFEKSTSKKDYKKMPEKLHPEKSVKYKKKTNENFEQFLEDKIVNMLDEYINPSMTKGDFLKTLNEKNESMILKRPKKMSMFSDEEGIEMKKPIGKITSLGMMENSTKEKERTKEREKTKTPGRRKNPFKDPNPGVKENPKAETKESTKEKEAPTKPGIKNPPKRKNPFKDPNPGVKENPKAEKEKQKSEFMSAIMHVLNL
jgi:hypothetical protein